MISLLKQSFAINALSSSLEVAPEHRLVTAGLLTELSATEGSALADKPREPREPLGQISLAPCSHVVPAHYDPDESGPGLSESSSLGSAGKTVAVTIAVKTVAAFVTASILFDGGHILLATGTGTMLMTFVALPTLLAAVGDIRADAASRVGPKRPARATDVRGQTAIIPTTHVTRPKLASLVPGERPVDRQMPAPEVCWTPQDSMASHLQRDLALTEESGDG